MSLASLAALCALVAPFQHGQVDEGYSPEIADASNEGVEALAKVDVPDGWSASLWAAEPLLANPVIFSIDDAGEVYVCETFRLHKGVTDMRSYMGWLHDELACTTVADRRAMFEKHLSPEELVEWSSEHERVRLIRDTDGDGTADTATVFADGFNDLMDGIAAGVLKVDGDVYYTCMPHLWKLTDEDGDGVSDARESLGHGFGVHVALLGHDLHGLVVGPDRRLYFSCGDRGLNLTSGSGAGIEIPHEGAVLRCELDGSNMEVVHRGLRNPQELVFDLHGDLFTGDNNSDGGDQARWVHIVPGGDSGWRHHYQYVTDPVVRGPWNAEKQWKPKNENQSKWLVPPIANIGAGPSGLDFAPGTGHGPELDGQFFMCDFRGNPNPSGVWKIKLERDGAFYKVESTERWLWKTLITDFQFGPDGYAYWTDWVAGWGMTGKGRVYRMNFDGADAELVEETRQLLAGSFDTIPSLQLRALLAHPDRRVRQRAHFALADKGAEGIQLLTDAAESPGSLMSRLHGIWGLWIAGKTHPEVVSTMLGLIADEHPDVRTQATKVLADLRVNEATGAFATLLDDPEPRVRFQAALGVSRVGSGQALQARDGLRRMLVDAAATDDPNLRHAAVQGLLGAWPATELASLATEDEAVALGALLALRHSRAELVAQVAGFLEGSELLAVEAANALWDPGPRGEAALACWPDRVTMEGARSVDRAAQGERIRNDERLQKLVSNDAFIRRVVAAARASRPESGAGDLLGLARWPIEDHVRSEVLRLLRERTEPSPIDPISGRWRPIEASEPLDLAAACPDGQSLQELFPGSSSDVQLAWLDLIIEMQGADEKRARYLRGFFEDASRPGEVRARAMAALVEGDSAAEVVDLALIDADDVLRAKALEALANLEPSVALSRLDRVLTQGTLPERRSAYTVLRKLPGDEADRLIADELVRLRAGLISPELRLDLVLAAEQRESSLVSSLLDAHRAAANALDAAIAPYLDGLDGGDPAKGKKLYDSTELSCLRCHSVTGDWSAQIGPSQHDVAARLPRLEMLVSIVDPNRRIADGYQAEMFFPFDDEPPVVGRVLVETADSVQVVDSDGERHMLQKSDIEVRRADLSAMPNGLADSISREQMRDLLAYLGTLTGSTE